jgi:gliding motility-associated-like protein
MVYLCSGFTPMKRCLLLVACMAMFLRLSSQNCSLLCNGGFDTFQTTGVGLFSVVPCWSTTASDGLMEVWGTGFNGVPSYSGSPQHVELNATQAATMYQDFPVVIGTVYTLCFAHRGRAGTDTMQVSVGPVGGPYVSLGKFGDGTTAWGYYCVTFTASSTTNYRVRFTPVFWAGNNIAIGNFLDQVSVSSGSFTLNASSSTICPGQTSTLTVTGANSHTWSTSSTASAIVVSPQATTVYSVAAMVGSCQAVGTKTIFVGSPSISVTSTAVCSGSSATLNASGVQNYTWLPGNLTGSTITVFAGSATSVYTVMASSAPGCTAQTTATVSVLPAPVINYTLQPSTCTGPGQLTVQAAGCPSCQVWLFPLNQQVSIVNNLQSGAYTISVQNMQTSCASVTSFVMPVSQATVNATGGNVCAGQTMFLQSTASPGVTYTWTGPNNFYSNQPSPQIANAQLSAAGAYTVQVSSGSGCTSSAVAQASVTIPPVLAVSVSGSTFCAQAFNGSPNTSTFYLGGANSYTVIPPPQVSYQSVGGNNSVYTAMMMPPFSAFPVVKTIVILGGAATCASSIAVAFTVIPNPTVSVVSSTNLVCAGESFTYQGLGAQQYVWTQQAPNTTFYAPDAGMSVPPYSSPFAAYGTSLGCHSPSASGSITVVPRPTVTVVPNSITMCAGATVTLRAEGTATLFAWYTTGGLYPDGGSVISITPKNNMVYSVIGSVYHCTASAVASVSVVPLPTPVAGFVKSPVCFNETATLNGSGGVTYTWTSPDTRQWTGSSVSFTASSPLKAGTYTLVAADAKGCRGFTTTDLNIWPNPDGYLVEEPNGRCVPFCTRFHFRSVLPAVTATWTTGKLLFAGESFPVCFSIPGTHTLTGLLSSSVSGCRSAQVYTLQTHRPPAADFTWEPSEFINDLDSVRLINTTSGDEQVAWNWHFAYDKSVKPEGEHVQHLFREPGKYTVALVVKDARGCSDTVVKYIDVEPDHNLYVPNVFTPDENGRNDTFRPVGSGVYRYHLQIFDRWGERVFSTTSFEAGWDGTFRGAACKEDIYTWKIELTTVKGIARKLLGRVTLLR